MSWTLGTTTLPEPNAFQREIIEKSTENLLNSGETAKRIENRKERFKLSYKNLTSTQLSSIRSEYELKAVRDFAVSETNLTITSTPVLIDIEDQDYTGSGIHYRVSLNLILTEVI